MCDSYFEDWSFFNHSLFLLISSYISISIYLNYLNYAICESPSFNFLVERALLMFEFRIIVTINGELISRRYLFKKEEWLPGSKFQTTVPANGRIISRQYLFENKEGPPCQNSGLEFPPPKNWYIRIIPWKGKKDR